MKLYSARNINEAIREASGRGRNLYVFDGTFWLRCFRAATRQVAGKPLCVLCGNGRTAWHVVTSSTVFDER